MLPRFRRDYLPAQPGGGERVVAASDALPETKPGSGERARGGVGYGGKQQTCGSLSINAKTALALPLGYAADAALALIVGSGGS